MEQFFTDITAALTSAGFSDVEAQDRARRAFSEIETTLHTPASFTAHLAALTGHFRETIEAATGGPVGRLLLTPLPNYVLPALPAILAEFPTAVLADNFKAGMEIGGRICVTLDEALADPNGFDACFLATIDQRLGRLFRERLPEERTVAAGDLVRFDHLRHARPTDPAREDFVNAIKRSPRPLLVLTAYLDVTVAPTLEALNESGFDVFIITRRAFAESDGHIMTDPGAIGEDRHYVADLEDMLWLLRRANCCPVLINYARFFASHWDLHNTIPLFAYSIAVQRATAGARLLHLYDAYQVCLRGLDAEIPSFALYRSLLDLADGIVVNSGAAPVLQELLGPEKPIIGFLRYGPVAEAQSEPDAGPFSIVMITGFLGEGNDPTRETADMVRELLRQGLHIHYYSSSATAVAFREQLSADQTSRFHLHAPIRDQRALVFEISRYHAGWFVADMSCCEALEGKFETPFAKALAGSFVPTAVATAGILYGCAGLPTFFNRGNFGVEMFPRGCAVEIELGEVEEVTGAVLKRDWEVMREKVSDSREAFSTWAHIRRLLMWLAPFYPSSRDQ